MGTKTQLMLGKYLDVKMVIPAIGAISALAVAHASLTNVVKDVDRLNADLDSAEKKLIHMSVHMESVDEQVTENGIALKENRADFKTIHGAIIELKILVQGLKDNG